MKNNSFLTAKFCRSGTFKSADQFKSKLKTLYSEEQLLEKILNVSKSELFFN